MARFDQSVNCQSLSCAFISPRNWHIIDSEQTQIRPKMQIENTLVWIINRHHVNATDMINWYLFKGKQFFLFVSRSCRDVHCGRARLKTGVQAVRMKKFNLNLGTNSLLWIKGPRENIKPRIAKRNVWCEGKRSSIQIYSAISQRRLGQTISC